VSDTIGLERTPVEQASSRVAMNWVNGAWVDAATRFPSCDPATGERIGTYAHAVRADAEVAVQAAVRAFKSIDWKDNRRLRSKVLNQLGDRFEGRREDLIDILSLENGKVRSEAACQVDMIPPNPSIRRGPNYSRSRCGNSSRNYEDGHPSSRCKSDGGDRDTIPHLVVLLRRAQSRGSSKNGRDNPPIRRATLGVARVRSPRVEVERLPANWQSAPEKRPNAASGCERDEPAARPY
jgi:hypothetical protein